MGPIKSFLEQRCEWVVGMNAVVFGLSLTDLEQLLRVCLLILSIGLTGYAIAEKARKKGKDEK